MARRYNQRPSSLLPRGILRNDLQRMMFDFNVMFLGMEVERKAHEEAMKANQPKGVTTSRNDALRLARSARQQADEVWGLS